MTVQIIPPGAETAEQYHSSGAWGSTLIGHFKFSPRLANAIRTGVYKPPETAAMRFGRLFHALMDPGSGFADTHRCGPEVDRRTTTWKTAVAEAKGITLLPKDDWDAMHRMADSVRANSVAASLLDGAKHEVGFRMEHDVIKVQCRADILQRDHIADLKTTTDLDDFGRSAATFGYHRQAALYRWIVHQACGRRLPFSFIVVENAEPFYRCRVVDLSAEFLEIGWTEVEAALADIVDRTRRDDWLDYRDAEAVVPPAWMRRAA